MRKIKYKKQPELVVFGIDALSSWFFDEFLRGCSPYKQIFEDIDNDRAVKREIRSVGHINPKDRLVSPEKAPAHTGPCWSSIYTGVGPKEHGISDKGWLEDRKDYANIEKVTIFETIESMGYTQGIFSMPVTYPVPRVMSKGSWAISGFPAPRDKDSMWPSEEDKNNIYGTSWELLNEMKKIPKNPIQKKDELPRQDKRGLKDWGEALLEDNLAEEVTDKIIEMEMEKLDCFVDMWALTSPDILWYGSHNIDKICHMFGLEPKDDNVRAVYTAVGSAIKEILNMTEPKNYIIVSDHGFKRGEHNHDHRGTLIVGSEDEEVRKFVKELDDPDMTDVPRVISKILDMGENWIGIDREDGRESDKDIIKERLDQMGYLG